MAAEPHLDESDTVGPWLVLRGCDDERLHIGAIVAARAEHAVGQLATDEHTVIGEVIARYGEWRFLRYCFSVTLDAATDYAIGGASYRVQPHVSGDTRIAYVSCNGQETGDDARDLGERNALWRTLAGEHEHTALSLLLHGGDQIYADEVLDAHAATQAWRDDPNPPPFANERLTGLQSALEAAFLERYLTIYAQSEPAWLMARIPSLCMWDDHDICDGWGSLSPAQQDHTVAATVFSVARAFFRLFQLGCGPHEAHPLEVDTEGVSQTQIVDLPGLRILAPDLRSERRPDRVMGPAGWAALRHGLVSTSASRLLVMSSVPALGPRLSWFERALRVLPGIQGYEDDLRDQWQSRAHRTEWQAFLTALADGHVQRRHRVTLISGEIHLATRATMATSAGPIHQLVASGIAHPPPPVAYARALGALAHLGEAPVPDYPIRLHPLPGQSNVYIAQRNYLVLERQGGHWQAWWQLEDDDATPPLALD